MLTTCPACRTTFRLGQEQLEARGGRVRCVRCQAVFDARASLSPEPPEASVWRRSGTREAAAGPATFALFRRRHDTRQPIRVGDTILMAEPPTRPARKTGHGRWRGALDLLLTALLALALAAQAAYFLRSPLAAWLPFLRPALEAACRPLGCTVPLAGDAAAIRVDASALEADPLEAGKATLRVGFSNRSGQVQPWPHLVLKLTDRRGGVLAQRAFAPADYLAAAGAVQAGIAPASEHEFSLPLDLGGLGVVGYEVTPAYP